MARPAPAPTRVRTSAKPRNISVRAKPPPAKKATAKPAEPSTTNSEHPDPNPIRSIADEAFTLVDAVAELKESFRAIGCLEMLLVPVERPRSDEFYVTPTELRALVSAVRAEMDRRIEAVGNSAQAIRSISFEYRGDE